MKLPGPARRVARGELIGAHARIATANDEGIIGLEGTIVDETLHTLTLRIGAPGGRRIQLAKAGAVWRIEDQDIPGEAIVFRPADRVKKVR